MSTVGAASMCITPLELRLQGLGELAGQTLLDPAERQPPATGSRDRRTRTAPSCRTSPRRIVCAQLRESQNVPLLILEAQRLGDGGNLSVSVELLGRARRLRPDNIEVGVLFNRFNDRNRRKEWEGDRSREWQRRQGRSRGRSATTTRH